MQTLHDKDLTLIFFIQSIMQPDTDFLLPPTLVLYLQLDFIFRGNASFTFKMEYMCMLIKFHSGLKNIWQKDNAFWWIQTGYSKYFYS